VSCAPPPESLGPAGAKGSESLRGGQAVLVGIAVHGCGGSVCEVAGGAGPRGVLLDVPEDLLHLVDLVTDLGELHADLGELQVGVLLRGDRHL
jgi:hypothetical protein